jgi:hypothetical protein
MLIMRDEERKVLTAGNMFYKPKGSGLKKGEGWSRILLIKE